MHPPTAIEDNLEPSNHLGQVDPKTIKVKQASEESEKDKKRRLALENLPPVGSMLNLDDFEVRAQAARGWIWTLTPVSPSSSLKRNAQNILTDQAWAYYSSAGDDEISESLADRARFLRFLIANIAFSTAKQQNRSSYNRIWFKPRILVPVGQVDYSTTLMANVSGADTKVSLPIYISPAAMAKLGHPDGELNLTRAAGRMGIVQGVCCLMKICDLEHIELILCVPFL